MRLDDFDKGIQVEDQRGSGGRGGMLGGRGGKLGLSGVVIAFIAAMVFGVDPQQMIGALETIAPASQTQGANPAGGKTLAESCSVDATSKYSCDTLSSLDQTWTTLFEQQGSQYQRPKLVFYGGQGQSGCGPAQSAMGPFYCPPDNGIYLDTSFFDELAQRFGASGDFAQAYVIAHEVGHHIQTITGTSNQVREAQRSASKAEANQLQVRMELQADCYAGVWAAKNASRIEPGDIEEGMTAANAIGDDTLQRSAGQRPVPESFTHGTSQQRMAWLNRGLKSGDPGQCDTFAARQL